MQWHPDPPTITNSIILQRGAHTRKCTPPAGNTSAPMGSCLCGSWLSITPLLIRSILVVMRSIITHQRTIRRPYRSGDCLPAASLRRVLALVDLTPPEQVIQAAHPIPAIAIGLDHE